MMTSTILAEKIKRFLPTGQLNQLVKKVFSPKELFKPKAETILGLNIGNYYLKGLVLEGDRICDYFIVQNQDLGKTLKNILAEKKISCNQVKLSLKDSNCLVRYFSFPKMEKKRLEQALSYELNKHIPFSPDEVYFDYYILRDLSPTELSILLAVAKKDFINNILEIFKELGLAVSEINLDSICLLNLFLDTHPDSKDSNSCILDVGNSFSIMTIVHKGVPFLTRDVKFSTKDIVAVAARAKGLKPADIQKQLLDPGQAKDLFEFIQSSISGLCKEMKSSFDYFEVNKGEHIDKLYLSGGLAQTKDIETIFSEALDVDIEVLTSFPSSLKKSDRLFSEDKFNRSGTSFAVAFGLML